MKLAACSAAARSRAGRPAAGGGARSRAGRRASTSSTTRSQPSSRPARQAAARAASRSSSRSATSRASCAASTSASPGSNSSPSLAVAQHLLVDRDARGDRHRAGRDRLQHAASCAGAMPRGRGAQHVGAREQRLERLAARPGQPHALAQRARRAAAGRSRRRGDQIVARHGAVERQRGAARAGRGAGRARSSSTHERDLDRSARGARAGAKRSRSTPGGTTS